MGELTTNASVVCMGGIDNVGGSVGLFMHESESRPFGQIVWVGVDILPGPLVHKRQFIGRDANNRAVFGMQLAQSVIDITIRTRQILEDMEGRPELRTRKSASWVDIGIIKGDS